MIHTDAVGDLVAAGAGDELERALVEGAAVKMGLVLAHERLVAAARAGQLGWWEWLADLDVLTGGDHFERLLRIEPLQGFCPAEVAFQQLHPGDRAAARDALTRAVCAGARVDLRLRVLGDEGALRWVEMRGRPCGARHGTPARVAGIVMACGGGHDAV